MSRILHKDEIDPKDITRIAVIGAGWVGVSFAYQLSTAALCEELVLIDSNHAKAEGEAMDLNHGISFAPTPVRIWAGDYSDCKDADIVVITAGAAQKLGQTRMDLVEQNAKVVRTVTEDLMKSGFDGILVVATNPVDVMAHVAWKASGLPKERVIGSGTVLDTARLRYKLGDYFELSPRNCHAYYMGEHGDTGFVAWNNARIYGKSIDELLAENEKYQFEDLEAIYADVRDAAYQIIEHKNAAYYAIGVGLLRIIRAIVRNENSVVTIGAHLDGEYGASDVHIGVPALIDRSGIRKIIEIELTNEEQQKFDASVQTIKAGIEKVEPAS
ncbi:L-lactate dehydrogenase [Exiguobacterium sp. MER 193]|uniref:L-lactate dehydrogenase n=1 Tax=Exiguobacterium sp. MER 193 TaxID=2939564 RepID=UPI00203A3F98|nr:L-lactate dehydrogenase [Exiguobacterium sp. MER 193]MCM3279644.1 L-lactate dehydrogenase [Exiguobacterium sp. MER 193]